MGQFSTQHRAVQFMTFDYPYLNHPSTILLIKAPLGIRELEAARGRVVRLKESYDFLPSVSAKFSSDEPGHLGCEIDVPMVETQLTIV